MNKALHIFLLIVFCFVASEAFAAPSKVIIVNTVQGGVGFGMALAMSISYNKNQSIPWAIAHGLCGWFYVGYVALKDVRIRIETSKK